jgi:hypothetical protein
VTLLSEASAWISKVRPWPTRVQIPFGKRTRVSGSLGAETRQDAGDRKIRFHLAHFLRRYRVRLTKVYEGMRRLFFELSKEQGAQLLLMTLAE